VDVQIRDLDQTVIENPAHDLIRLGLSLASAARGSDLPGVTTARMMEEMVLGYSLALRDRRQSGSVPEPEVVKSVRRRALGRKWSDLARARIRDVKPNIPLGRRFWALSHQERKAIEDLFKTDPVREIVAHLNARSKGSAVTALDAAYWMKGCSSLGGCATRSWSSSRKRIENGGTRSSIGKNCAFGGAFFGRSPDAQAQRRTGRYGRPRIIAESRRQDVGRGSSRSAGAAARAHATGSQARNRPVLS
jgi:hypothetical protein